MGSIDPSSYDAGSQDFESEMPPLDLRDLTPETVKQLALMHGYKVKSSKRVYLYMIKA